MSTEVLAFLETLKGEIRNQAEENDRVDGARSGAGQGR